MQNNELFKILRSFSGRELILFEDYLDSPYFNRSRKKVEFFAYVKRFYPLFTDIRVNKKAIFEGLYPGREYNDSTIRNLLSDLHRDALKFLVHENFNKAKINKYRYLFTELNGRNLDEEWGKAIERFDDNSETGVDYNYFLNKHIAAGNKFNYSHLNEKISKEKVLTDSINYADCSSINLLYHFISEITTNYLNIVTYSSQFNLDLGNNITNKIMSFVDFPKILSIIPEEEKNKFIVRLYLSLLRMYTDIGNERLYFEYKELFYNNIDKLSRDEISMHYSKLIGYCILKIQQSDSSEKFNIELFDLYNTVLQNEYYKDNKTHYLTHEEFRNIMIHGLRIKEYSWLGSFIKTYSTKVHPNDVDNMYNYGNAYLNYHMGKYSEALDNLQNIKPEFLFYKFDVRNLTLMVYYELGYFEEALYLIKTYLEFLRKNRVINSERKKRYLNFVKFTEKLILYKYGESKHELGYIRYRLASHSMTAHKPWLMEKISMLENKFSRAV